MQISIRYILSSQAGTNNKPPATRNSSEQSEDSDASESNMDYHQKSSVAEMAGRFRSMYVSLEPSTRAEVGHQLRLFLVECEFHGYPCSGR